MIAVILIIGFSGLVAQVILLRELLVSFYGNELTMIYSEEENFWVIDPHILFLIRTRRLQKLGEKSNGQDKGHLGDGMIVCAGLLTGGCQR